MNVPPPVLLHSPATGELEPFRLSSPFANNILLFFFLIISAAFTTAGAYTKFSAYIKWPSALSTTFRRQLSLSITVSYIFTFDTIFPIGARSPSTPKYPLSGFSQITCFPAFIALSIISSWTYGGVHISTTSISGSSIKSLKSRDAFIKPYLSFIPFTCSKRRAEICLQQTGTPLKRFKAFICNSVALPAPATPRHISPFAFIILLLLN